MIDVNSLQRFIFTESKPLSQLALDEPVRDIALCEMPSPAQRLTENVEYWMAKREIATQGELAEKAGYAQSYISQILNGKREPSNKCLRALAKALSVSVEALLLHKAGRRPHEPEKEDIDPGLLDRFRRLNVAGRNRLLEDADLLLNTEKYSRAEDGEELVRKRG